MPKPRTPRRPDDCLECPYVIDERKLGIDDGLACDLPGGPTKITGELGYDGLMFYAAPKDCPLWLAWERAKGRDEALAEDAAEGRREDRGLGL